MKKQIASDSTKSIVKRVAILVVIFVVFVGGVYTINLIMRGSGKHERALAEAVFASFKQESLRASLDASQQSQVSSFSATGTLNLVERDKYKADINVKINNQDDSTEIPVAVVGSAAGNELYLKTTEAPKVVEMFGTQVGETKPMLDSIAKKINAKWLRIPQQQGAATDCTSEILSSLASNKTVQQQVTDSYIANRFVVVEDVKETDGQTVYTVTSDERALKGFVKSIKTKDFFKKIDSCNASYDPFGEQAQQAQQQPAAPQQQLQAPTPIRITVNSKNLVSKVAIQQQSQQGITSLQAKLNYDPSQTISLPNTDVIEYSEISSEVQQVVGAFSQQQQAAVQ